MLEWAWAETARDRHAEPTARCTNAPAASPNALFVDQRTEWGLVSVGGRSPIRVDNYPGLEECT